MSKLSKKFRGAVPRNIAENFWPTRPYHPGESAVGGCPKKKPVSDAAGRREPRGKGSEMTEVSGNLGVFAVFSKKSACRLGKRSEVTEVSGNLGVSAVLHWLRVASGKRVRFDRRIRAPRARHGKPACWHGQPPLAATEALSCIS